MPSLDVVRSVDSRSKKVLVLLYKTLVHPQLEHCVQFWAPHYKRYIAKLKSAQHRVTRMVARLGTDPQMVLLMSVTMENLRKDIPRRNDHKGTVRWPLFNMWLITKAGMILSRAIGKSSLAVGHPIRVVMQDGILLEGYKLNMQKRDKNNIYQHWEFRSDGCIHSKAYPEFVLTYLEELNVREEVTQTEYHTHHGAQSAVHQETDSNSAEEVTVSSQRQVLQNNVCNCNEKQLSGPLDAHLMPEGPLRENRQLTVALMRKLEEKHPKASAQR
ncbi:Doublecortin domain-containing protein 1 [Varanus komodoensis]|nr:Doublecortin domain-containing protein 1 [Varanus komodoensis]